MKGSAFQYMYDGYGNTFLDAYNNIPHIGHAHPEITKTGSLQMATLNTNTRYLYDAFPEYAEALLSKFPKELDTVFFVNSGSAASDLAIRLANSHTNQNTIMVMEHGYHGNTQMAIDISHYKYANQKGQAKKTILLKPKFQIPIEENTPTMMEPLGKHMQKMRLHKWKIAILKFPHLLQSL